MSASSRKVIIAALLGNSAIAVTKFVAAASTGSSAMFSEGIHSLVDTGNQVLLLWGLRQAKKPPAPLIRTYMQELRTVVKKYTGQRFKDATEFRKWLEKNAKSLGLDPKKLTKK